MTALVLHPSSRQQLLAFAAKPSHALILLGAEGIGKSAASRWLALKLLGLADENALSSYPYFKVVAAEDRSISIDAVRELLQFTKLKVAGGLARIIIIDEAHLMGGEAQNALLKLLEEPPAGTIIVLTAASVEAVLPTIRSRAQTITLQPPARADLNSHFAAEGYAAAKIDQAYFMSGGLPGLMSALLAGDDEHPLAKSVQQARELLRVSTFERLAMVDALAKQRPECARLLFVLQQMAHAALEQTAEKDTDQATQARSLARWQHVLSAAYRAETSLLANAQPKLLLTNLMLSL
jgi:DNA polymerase-3 subunit delta'